MPCFINKPSAENKLKRASGHALIAIAIHEAVTDSNGNFDFPINLQPNLKLHKSAVICGDQH